MAVQASRVRAMERHRLAKCRHFRQARAKPSRSVPLLPSCEWRRGSELTGLHPARCTFLEAPLAQERASFRCQLALSTSPHDPRATREMSFADLSDASASLRRFGTV